MTSPYGLTIHCREVTLLRETTPTAVFQEVYVYVTTDKCGLIIVNCFHQQLFWPLKVSSLESNVLYTQVTITFVCILMHNSIVIHYIMLSITTDILVTSLNFKLLFIHNVTPSDFLFFSHHMSSFIDF